MDRKRKATTNSPEPITPHGNSSENSNNENTSNKK
jgi:hypothetical protein